jgi:transcriptional regulator with XRE-family HTH domain
MGKPRRLRGRNNGQTKRILSGFQKQVQKLVETSRVCGNLTIPVVGRLMWASSWNPEWGKRLRAERERVGLSLRDVETLSHSIAEKMQSSDYNIAHTSLADIENGKWPPTLHRLYTLSVIYGRDYDRLASVCGVPVSEALKEHKKLVLPRTYLIGPAPEKHKLTALSAVELREKLRAERTNLVPKMIETWDEVPLVFQQMDGSSPLYGYIGMDDYTLHPFVRPGAFVRIDPRQKKIPALNWHGDHDRPIFFIELRERYVCSWCEMHDTRLILIPSHESKRRAQHVRYPAEATIVGRVTGVSMDLVEPSENEARA